MCSISVNDDGLEEPHTNSRSVGSATIALEASGADAGAGACARIAPFQEKLRFAPLLRRAASAESLSRSSIMWPSLAPIVETDHERLSVESRSPSRDSMSGIVSARGCLSARGLVAPNADPMLAALIQNVSRIAERMDLMERRVSHKLLQRIDMMEQEISTFVHETLSFRRNIYDQVSEWQHHEHAQRSDLACRFEEALTALHEATKTSIEELHSALGSGGTPEEKDAYPCKLPVTAGDASATDASTSSPTTSPGAVFRRLEEMVVRRKAATDTLRDAFGAVHAPVAAPARGGEDDRQEPTPAARDQWQVGTGSCQGASLPGPPASGLADAARVRDPWLADARASAERTAELERVANNLAMLRARFQDETWGLRISAGAHSDLKIAAPQEEVSPSLVQTADPLQSQTSSQPSATPWASSYALGSAVAASKSTPGYTSNVDGTSVYRRRP